MFRVENDPKKKKRKRKRNKSGWARTKDYPHKKHPATYRRKSAGSNDIEYITFTHSDEVEIGNGSKIRTIPLSDNVSPSERNKQTENTKTEKNRSYAYPKVFVGKRSALQRETSEFDPVDFDKKRIDKMFNLLPREDVPVTGGAGQYRKRKKKKPRK